MCTLIKPRNPLELLISCTEDNHRDWVRDGRSIRDAAAAHQASAASSFEEQQLETLGTHVKKRLQIHGTMTKSETTHHRSAQSCNVYRDSRGMVRFLLLITESVSGFGQLKARSEAHRKFPKR